MNYEVYRTFIFRRCISDFVIKLFFQEKLLLPWRTFVNQFLLTLSIVLINAIVSHRLSVDAPNISKNNFFN